jgi:4-hydroxy-2-oxoheptanedioate aldolase
MNTMQASNRLQTAFAQGKQSMGMWQMIPGANVSRILARSGCDWVLVDCEHGNIDGEFFLEMLLPRTLSKGLLTQGG